MNLRATDMGVTKQGPEEDRLGQEHRQGGAGVRVFTSWGDVGREAHGG